MADADVFGERFCYRCERGGPLSKINCPIYKQAMAKLSDHPDFPREWIYDDNGKGICTAFTQINLTAE